MNRKCTQFLTQYRALIFFKKKSAYFFSQEKIEQAESEILPVYFALCFQKLDYFLLKNLGTEKEVILVNKTKCIYDNSNI